MAYANLEDVLRYFKGTFSTDYKRFEDEEFLLLDDEDFKMYIDMVLMRTYPQYTAEKMPKSIMYEVLLLARIDLLRKLAVSTAPFYDISASDAGSISISQRFEHYNKLAEQAQSEYENYIKNKDLIGGNSNSGGTDANGNLAETGGTLTTLDVTISNRYMTKYNSLVSVPPRLLLSLDSTSLNSAFISWNTYRFNPMDFRCYRVYLMKKVDGEKLIETYTDTETQFVRTINDKAKLVIEIGDKMNKDCALRGLSAGEYKCAVEVVTRSGRYGSDEIEFTISDTPSTEVNVGDLP